MHYGAGLYLGDIDDGDLIDERAGHERQAATPFHMDKERFAAAMSKAGLV